MPKMFEILGLVAVRNGHVSRDMYTPGATVAIMGYIIKPVQLKIGYSYCQQLFICIDNQAFLLAAGYFYSLDAVFDWYGNIAIGKEFELIPQLRQAIEDAIETWRIYG